MGRRTAILVVLQLLAISARAGDVYVLRFNAGGPFLNACTQMVWSDQVLFYNPFPNPVTVKLLEATYGISSAASREIVLPPNRATSLAEAKASWDGLNAPWIGVAHLDVPDGLEVRSRTVPSVLNCTGPCLCPVGLLPQGAASQRVYRELIPANTVHIHLGSDLRGINSRINVTVYNGGLDPAGVIIEVRQSCGDLILSSAHFLIDPHSVATAGGLSAQVQPCPSSDTNTYVRVVSTQPGLSWVTTLANDVVVPRLNLLSN